ncbi:MAG: hypothetical protein E7415_00765 [Ruminococcaceae bacterium]|nr:hypothetical protein [Oscillospiraceae bacterium]
MNEYIEYIVEKKKSMKDVFKCAFTVGFAFLFIWPLLFIPMYPMLKTVLIVGIVYGASKIVGSVNVEFEYIITDNEMDIDKIVNKKSRKRLVTVNLRRTEEYGKCNGEAEKRYLNNSEYRVIEARSDRGGKNNSYLTYKSDEGKGILLFTPGEKIEEKINETMKYRF